MRYETHEEISQEELDILCNGLKSNAAEKTVGLTSYERFSILVRDSDDAVIGGAKGVTYFQCLYVDILWVDKAHRNKDIGTTLLQKAEQLARDRGCTFSTLTTMSYEALPFYQKQGYAIEFTREGYQGGLKCHCLRKSL